MKVRLAYGAGGLEVELPDDRTTVVEPTYHAGAADEPAVLRDALRTPVAGPPLSELAKPGHEGRDLDVRRHPRAAARQDDPGGARRAGRARRGRRDPRRHRHAPRQHRRGDPARCSATSSSIAVRVVNHDARDPTRSPYLGEHGNGVPVRINRAGSRPTCGSPPASSSRTSSPASAAGRSSSRPGSPGSTPCSCSTTRRRIGDPQATLGRSPRATRSTTTSARRRRGGAALRLRRDPQPRAAGDRGVRRRARADARAPRARPRSAFAMRPVPEPFDVVVTSNSGYPLDQNLYQAVKGMSAAAKVVKPGGLIVCAAECRDGFPGHGSYRQLLESARVAARVPARDRGSPTTSRPTSGRCRSSPTSRTTRGSSCTPGTCPTTSCAPSTSSRRATSRRPSPPRAIRRPSASCPRARRRSPTSRMTEPVVIVGGSLVGLTTAMLLGSLDVPSLVVERHAGTAIHPRAGHFQLGTMEMLRQVGLEDEVRSASLATYHPTGGIVAVESLAGRELATYVESSTRASRATARRAGCSSTRTCSSRSCSARRPSSERRCATAWRRPSSNRTRTAWS